MEAQLNNEAVGNFLTLLVAVISILWLWSYKEYKFPSHWHVRLFCKCGWSDEPHNGNRWFTDVRYPVCPSCGSSKKYEEKVVKYSGFKLVEKKEINDA